MCFLTQPHYRCGCPAPPQRVFRCTNHPSMVNRPASRPDPSANLNDNRFADRTVLRFCCSTRCCEAAIERKEIPYYSICAEQDAFLRCMDTLSEEEFLNRVGRRGKREEALDELEEEKVRHWDCEEDRARYRLELAEESGADDICTSGGGGVGSLRKGPIRRGTM